MLPSRIAIELAGQRLLYGTCARHCSPEAHGLGQGWDGVARSEDEGDVRVRAGARTDAPQCWRGTR